MLYRCKATAPRRGVPLVNNILLLRTNIIRPLNNTKISAKEKSDDVREQEKIYRVVIEEQRRSFDILDSSFSRRKSHASLLIAAMFAVFSFVHLQPLPEDGLIPNHTIGYFLYWLGVSGFVLTLISLLAVIWPHNWRIPTEEEKINKISEDINEDNEASYLRYLKYVSRQYSECWKYNRITNRLKGHAYTIGLISLIVSGIILLLIKVLPR